MHQELEKAMPPCNFFHALTMTDASSISKRSRNQISSPRVSRATLVTPCGNSTEILQLIGAYLEESGLWYGNLTFISWHAI